ncbi:MAG: peptidoglycan bridge formation glycyltransferase FemA/FemB family protein, partial [Deltaproteobacteria bacterium]
MTSEKDNIRIINPTAFEGWDELVLSHPEAAIFHSSAWARVLSESYGYTPFYFTVLDRQRLSALLPVMEVKSLLTGTRGVSLPFTDYCDPILDGETSLNDLFDHVIDFGKKQRWKYIELRTCFVSQEEEARSKEQGARNKEEGPRTQAEETRTHSPSSFRLSPFPFPLTPCLSYMGHTIDLDGGPEDLFKRFKDSARRNIRKAGREGVEAGIFDSLESVREFSRLNSMTRREHGLPPQPLGFFEKVHEHVIRRGLGFVALASYQGKSVAGAVYFHFGRKAFYKYGASDRKFQNLRANNLVMW